MWTAIHRARRFLGGEAARLPATRGVPEIAARIEPTPGPGPIEDSVIVLGRVEIDRLSHALEGALGDTVEPPNSPARLERALELLLKSAASPGRARVLRRPAGVSTPESWEIHLDGAERTSGNAVREAGRTGRFNA